MAGVRMTFSIDNLKQAEGEMDIATKEILLAVARVVYENAQAIITKAKMLAPVKTGALASTGHTDPPIGDGDTITSRLGFGGPAAVYAHYQHGQGFAPGYDRPELVTWQSGYTKPFHKRGGEGYLYYPLMAFWSEMPDELGRAISHIPPPPGVH